MKKRIIAALLALGFCLLLSSCADRTVMKIGETEIGYSEYRYYLLNNKRDSFDGIEALSEEQLAELSALTEENAKRSAAIAALAKEYGAKLSDDDMMQVEAYIASYIADDCYNDEGIYREALESYYMSDALFRKLQQDTALAYNTMEKMCEVGAIKTDDATIDALFASDELLCIKEIYFSYPSDELKDYVKSRAEEAMTRIESGEDFAQIMREYTSYNEASMPSEYGYYTTEYEMPEYIWETAISLSDGEYSEIIESAYGYHIVMRCEKDTAYMEEIRSDIADRYVSAMYTKALYETVESLTVEYTSYGKKLQIDKIS